MTIKSLLLALVLLGVNCAYAQAQELRCALIKDDNGVVAEYRSFAQDNPLLNLDEDGCPPDIAQKGVAWLPAPVVSPPSFDPATEVLEGPNVVVGESEVTTSYSVRAKTAEELQAELDAAQNSDIDSMGEIGFKALLILENRYRVMTGRATVTAQQLKDGLKALLGHPVPDPTATDITVLRESDTPQRLYKFTASVSFGTITGAAMTDKALTVPGLQTGDFVVSVVFPQGLTPATVGYTVLGVGSNDTLNIRFMKIASGNVSPGNQNITVLVLR